MTYILIGIVMAFYGWIAYSAAHEDNNTNITELHETK